MDKLLTDKLYTVEDIANMTSLTTRTIRNYLKDGTLKGRKIGGQWRFMKEDLMNFIESGNYVNNVSDKNREDVLDFLDGVNTFADNIGEIQTCTIVDLYQDAKIIKNKLDKLGEFIESFNGTEKAKNNWMSFHYEWIESESKGRMVIFAKPQYIIEALKILQ